MIWEADGTALELPVELLRLTTATGEDLGPLALRAGVTVLRRVSGAPPVEPVTAPGPVKILAAVAADLLDLRVDVQADQRLVDRFG